MTRGFDWSVLRLAFRITGNQTAVWSIYSEAMLKDARPSGGLSGRLFAVPVRLRAEALSG